MSAKRKLNVAYFYGSVLIAALIGFATGSISVFVVVLAALLAAHLYSGEIR